VRILRKVFNLIDLSVIEAGSVSDSTLPVVSILLPLYKEKRTLHYLIESLLRSNYPMHKLDIRFLVESDDTDTSKSIMNLSHELPHIQGVDYDPFGIPSKVRVWGGVTIEIDYVYHADVRTKPNALNVGLHQAKGRIVAVYDADDKPDPNQIRKVAVYMLKHPEVACVQTRLAYYNSDQSILTKLFTIEYIQHFLVILPEQYAMKNVIPLGGSSNFFRVEVLRDLKGWDPMNVTEDADFGLRMARRGYTTVPINSITWEEAPPKMYIWIRQRVRWNKGFVYTLFTHFRNPLKLIRDIGFKPALFAFHILSYPIVSAVSLIGWIFFVVYWLDWVGIFPVQPLAGWINAAFNYSPLLYLVSLGTLAFGIIYDLLVSLEGLFRQEDEYALKKLRYILITPIYHVLHNISSIIALIELAVYPHLWHKTPHGFSIEELQD
jgi:cellulose synthase/poly-beta-1,6-N-acetylglucosamine synthase-like glycosyltransferase